MGPERNLEFRNKVWSPGFSRWVSRIVSAEESFSGNARGSFPPAEAGTPCPPVFLWGPKGDGGHAKALPRFLLCNSLKAFKIHSQILRPSPTNVEHCCGPHHFLAKTQVSNVRCFPL